MAYWLLKSEPDVFNFADLQAVGREPWNGIRNYQARNFLRQMQPGDLGLFYHSNAQPPHVAGVLRVVSEAYPDNLQFDPASEYHDPRSSAEAPRWSMVDVAPVAALPRPLSLSELRELPEWASSPLVRRGNRLSVLPLTEAEFLSALEAGQLKL